MRPKQKQPEGIRLGIQPTCWTNDDFPELGKDTSYQQILDETASSGFVGGSTGHNYPSHPQSLTYALNRRGLGVTSTWVGTRFTAEGQYDATLELVRGQIKFLKSVEARDIVVAELASAVNQVRTKAVLADRPIFNSAQWFLLLRGLNEAGKIAAEAGMRLCYHPHVGTGVQVREEIDRLMAGTHPSVVSMCLDTGHALFGGVEPVQLTRDYIDRIGHVHLKNVRKPVMDRAVAGKFSFYQAVLQGVFTVPGDPDGAIDFDPIFQSFKKHGYRGWIVVEAEQDPGVANPLAYARMARKFIRKRMGV